MSELTPELEQLLDGNRIGVIATRAADGQPRQSVVYYARHGDRLLVSTLADRLKTKDVLREGRASICVHGHEQPYPSAVFSGPAEIRTTGIGPDTALVMQRVSGADQPPEPQTDEALAGVGRVLLDIRIERISAVSHV
jgi:hypothetical protein